MEEDPFLGLRPHDRELSHRARNAYQRMLRAENGMDGVEALAETDQFVFGPPTSSTDTEADLLALDIFDQVGVRWETSGRDEPSDLIFGPHMDE